MNQRARIRSNRAHEAKSSIHEGDIELVYEPDEFTRALRWPALPHSQVSPPSSPGKMSHAASGVTEETAQSSRCSSQSIHMSSSRSCFNPSQLLRPRRRQSPLLRKLICRKYRPQETDLEYMQIKEGPKRALTPIGPSPSFHPFPGSQNNIGNLSADVDIDNELLHLELGDGAGDDVSCASIDRPQVSILPQLRSFSPFAFMDRGTSKEDIESETTGLKPNDWEKVVTGTVVPQSTGDSEGNQHRVQSPLLGWSGIASRPVKSQEDLYFGRARKASGDSHPDEKPSSIHVRREMSQVSRMSDFSSLGDSPWMNARRERSSLDDASIAKIRGELDRMQTELLSGKKATRNEIMKRLLGVAKEIENNVGQRQPGRRLSSNGHRDPSSHREDPVSNEEKSQESSFSDWMAAADGTDGLSSSLDSSRQSLIASFGLSFFFNSSRNDGANENNTKLEDSVHEHGPRASETIMDTVKTRIQQPILKDSARGRRLLRHEKEQEFIAQQKVNHESACHGISRHVPSKTTRTKPARGRPMETKSTYQPRSAEEVLSVDSIDSNQFQDCAPGQDLQALGNNTASIRHGHYPSLFDEDEGSDRQTASAQKSQPDLSPARRQRRLLYA